MKKEITIYELLGLIKDDKAPKKISIFNKIYLLGGNNEYKTYYRECDKTPINDIYVLEYILNTKVEIIEEPKQLEEIEIENDNTSHFYIRDKHGTRCQMTKHSKIITEKVNEIIRYIKDKENKNEKD